MHVDARLRLLDHASALPVLHLRRLARWLGRPLDRLGAGAIALRCVLVVAILTGLAIALVPTTGPLVAVSLSALLALEPFTDKARSRREEFAADRTAAELGYGPELARELRLEAQLHPERTGLRAIRNRLYSTHPPSARRVQTIRDHGLRNQT
jgi:Zn-dependent protease with chaperone function